MQHVTKQMPKPMQSAIARYLASGGKIQRIPTGARALKPGQIRRADQYAVFARGYPVAASLANS